MVRTPRNTIIDQKPNGPSWPNATAHGNRKRDFEIEDDEQDGDQVEPHVEFHAGVIERR